MNNKGQEFLKWKLKYGLDFNTFPIYNGGGSVDDIYEFAYRNFMIDYRSFLSTLSKLELPAYSYENEWDRSSRAWEIHSRNRMSVDKNFHMIRPDDYNEDKIEYWKELFIQWLLISEEIHA
jgi:hypothetical protein